MGKAQSDNLRPQDARLRALINRVGSIDLISNIRAIREARDFLDSMLAAAERELSGKSGQVRVVTGLTLTAGATVADKARREGATKPTSSDLQPDSVAAWAAIAIRQAGRPLSTRELVKAIEEEQGHKVKVTTLLGSLYRWIKKKSVFYLAGPGTFGLIEMKK